MNILVICHYGLYQRPESSFVHNQVREYVKLGHRVRIIVPVAIGKVAWNFGRLRAESYCLDGAEILPVRFLSLSKYGKRWFNTCSAINIVRFNIHKLLKEFVPDVIHAHTIGFDSEVGTYFKKITGAPLVVTTHGSDTSIPLNQGQSEDLKRYCDAADQIVAVSSKLAEKLKMCGTLTPITVILNGFNIANVNSNTKRDMFSVIQVSHLQRQKRVNVTIEAFAALKKLYSQATLTIIGDGPLKEELENLCKKLGVVESVKFLGHLTNSQVLKEMSRHQFFIMPSVNEGFGIVYMEAMASGCLTIGTEKEGISDVIHDHDNGFLVEADAPNQIVEAMVWCLNHQEAADEIANRGRQTVCRLTWKNNSINYIGLFEGLLYGT